MIKPPAPKSIVRSKPMVPDGPVKSRLNLLIVTVLDESSFDPTIKKIVSKMIINFLRNASERDLQEKIEELRDKIIPFVLFGPVEEENAEPPKNTDTNG